MTYALVRISPLAVLVSFTDATVPNPLVWPNGDITYAVSPGEERVGCRLVNVVVTPDRPNEFYHEGDLTPSLNGAILTYTRQWLANDLTATKSALAARLDNDAETVRLKYITPGSGQALIYQRKYAEANDFQSDQSPNPSNYPLLAASIGIEGANLSAIATLVIQRSDQLRLLGAQIERRRLLGKAAITAASNVDAALAAYKAVTWDIS